MTTSKFQSNKIHKCKKCGRSHTAGNCPAYRQKCKKCNGINHFAVGCKHENVTCFENVLSNQAISRENPNIMSQGSIFRIVRKVMIAYL